MLIMMTLALFAVALALPGLITLVLSGTTDTTTEGSC
jgi:hypothetical protein